MSNFKISIPDPCNENWNEMTPTEKGRFCGSCQKEVTDFSKMTKIEIQDFFIKKATESTCGRFEARQITEFNRPEVKTRKLNSKPWWVAAATIFIFAKQGISQGKPQIENQSKVEISKSPVAMEAPKESKVDPGDEVINDSLVTITGQVIDEYGEPIFAATIRIKDTSLGCLTDFDGKFKLIIPSEYQDSIKIAINFLGFDKVEKTYYKLDKSKNIGIIKLTEHSAMLGGAIMITSVVSVQKPPLKVRAKNIFLRMFR